MKLSEEQRLGIHKMLSWVEGKEEVHLQLQTYYGIERDRDFIKDQLLKILFLDEYNVRDTLLLNELRNVYLTAKLKK